MKRETTLNKYKLHLSAQCWGKISSSCNWRTVSKRNKLATRIALHCVGRRRQASGQASGRRAGRQAGLATVAIPSFSLVGIHAFLHAVLPSILIFYSQHINMEVFYLHLLAPVTSNKRVFQFISNFCHLTVATLRGKSYQMY